MRIIHLNSSAHLSAGRVASDLCRYAQKAGHETLLCYGRGSAPVDIPGLRVGDVLPVEEQESSGTASQLLDQLVFHGRNLSTQAGLMYHTAVSRFNDRCGLYSRRATQRLMEAWDLFAPDLIHLHHLHGDYLHLPTLFSYLQTSNIPVVWTLHDCWPFTGHCACPHFPIQPYLTSADRPDPSAPVQCLKWQKACHHCPRKKSYPTSLWKDQSALNYAEKKDWITSLPNLTVVTPSHWMRDQAAQSFLGGFPIQCLPSGIDLSLYTPCADERHMQDIALFYGLDRLNGRRMVLSVADEWDEHMGLADLVTLAGILGEEYCVTLAGLSRSQIDALPEDMLGLPRIANAKDLCVLYTAADCYLSLRQGEAAATSLLEAMACGTQVLAYDSAALPEAITPKVGEVLPTGDMIAAADAVRRLCDTPKDPLFCIARAAQFGAKLCYEPYLRLYEQLLSSSKNTPTAAFLTRNAPFA